jgi:hypothetical protein
MKDSFFVRFEIIIIIILIIIITTIITMIIEIIIMYYLEEFRACKISLILRHVFKGLQFYMCMGKFN